MENSGRLYIKYFIVFTLSLGVSSEALAAPAVEPDDGDMATLMTPMTQAALMKKKNFIPAAPSMGLVPFAFTGPDSREITFPVGMPGWLDVTQNGAAVLGGACPNALPNKSDQASVTQTTKAIQCRLDAMGVSGNPANLYFPTGTYYINSTLSLNALSKQKEFRIQPDGSYIYGGFFGGYFHLLGRHPSTTKIVWAGSCAALTGMSNPKTVKYSSVFSFDGIGVNIERLTVDGRNCAGTGLEFTSNVSVISPVSVREMIIQNMKQIGLVGDRFALTAAEADPCLIKTSQGIACKSNYNNPGMVSEVSIMNSQFLNNGYAGVFVGAWNALDYWIYNDVFDGNGIAVAITMGGVGEVPPLPWPDGTGGAGGFNATNCLVKNSKGADFLTGNGGRFTVRSSYSVGGKGPFVKGGNAAGHWYLHDNTVIAGPGVIPIILPRNNTGFLLQNRIFTQNDLPAVATSSMPLYSAYPAAPLLSSIYNHQNAIVTSIGNSYSSSHPYANTTVLNGLYTFSSSLQGTAIKSGVLYQCSNGSTSLIDQRTACPATIAETSLFNLLQLDDKTSVSRANIPALPPAPTLRAEVQRNVVALSLSPSDGAGNAKKIQAALNQLAHLQASCGSSLSCQSLWGIVYLPPGHFPVNATIQVPANAHLQIIGTGSTSHLYWGLSNADTNNSVIHLNSPAHVILKDFAIYGSAAINVIGVGDGITADVVDAPGSRVLAEASRTSRAPFRSENLGDVAFEMRQFAIDVNAVITGNGNAVQSGYFGMFGGNPTALTIGGGLNLKLQDTWYEGGKSDYLSCTDWANASIETSHVSPRDGGHPIEDSGATTTSFEWGHCVGNLAVLTSDIYRNQLQDGAPKASINLPANSPATSHVLFLNNSGNLSNYGVGEAVVPLTATGNAALMDQGFFTANPKTPTPYLIAQNRFLQIFQSTNAVTRRMDVAVAKTQGQMNPNLIRQALNLTMNPNVHLSRVVPAITDPTKTDIQIYNVAVWFSRNGFTFQRP